MGQEIPYMGIPCFPRIYRVHPILQQGLYDYEIIRV